MTQATQAADLPGRNMIDREGSKIGKIDELYFDEDDGRTEWALVNTGMFGSKKSFVPLRGSSWQSEQIKAAVSKDQVKDAPRIEDDGELSPVEEERLYEHYGMADSYPAREAGEAAPARESGEAMTRSEEEMRVGTERRERGRARLRKYVVTEHEQRTVPVQHEEIRVEREPIDASNRDEAMSGPSISEDEHEVVLTEDRPVVEKETVPKERVRMEKESYPSEETVADDVRKERIDSEGDTGQQSR